MKLKSLKIASLLLLVCFVSFGQTSVPNTDTFSLQDVYNAVHAHTSGTQGNLQSCFDNAISGYFDPNYSYAPANSMLRFRNYKPNESCDYPVVFLIGEVDLICQGNPTVTVIITNESTAGQACYNWFNYPYCAKAALSTFYGRIPSFSIGNQFWGDYTPCTKLTNTGWYFMLSDYDGSNYTKGWKVNISSGIIQNITQCYP